MIDDGYKKKLREEIAKIRNISKSKGKKINPGSKIKVRLPKYKRATVEMKEPHLAKYVSRFFK